MPEGSDLAQDALDAAKRLSAAGLYAEALEQFEWFHHHALEHTPSFYGVRLSFALSSWAEMGAKYPPALESLRKIRDRDTELVRLPGSSKRLFHDVVAINRALGENTATMTLFREIEHAWPELARSRFSLMSSEAFDADGDLFVRYTPDLLAYGQKLLDEHHELMARSVKNVPEVIRSDPKFAGIEDHLRQKFGDDLRRSIQRLATLAFSAGKVEVSKSIKALINPTKSIDDGLPA